MRKCWKSWAIPTITVTNVHQNVQKRRDFQSELDFCSKGGAGGGGVENGKKPCKTQFFTVKSGRYGPLLGSNATHSSASRTDSSEFERERDQKRSCWLAPATRVDREWSGAGGRGLSCRPCGRLIQHDFRLRAESTTFEQLAKEGRSMAGRQRGKGRRKVGRKKRRMRARIRHRK
jgi:hypothetical protein